MGKRIVNSGQDEAVHIFCAVRFMWAVPGQIPEVESDADHGAVRFYPHVNAAAANGTCFPMVRRCFSLESRGADIQ